MRQQLNHIINTLVFLFTLVYQLLFEQQRQPLQHATKMKEVYDKIVKIKEELKVAKPITYRDFEMMIPAAKIYVEQSFDKFVPLLACVGINYNDLDDNLKKQILDIYTELKELLQQ